MKAHAPVLLAGFLATTLIPFRTQEGDQETKKKSGNPVTRFFQEENDRLTKEIEGSWMLMDYTDPAQQPLEDAARGFATFHDGFLTMMIAVNAIETRMFRTREHVFLISGAYRYRFDEHATLQLSSVMSFTNDTEDAEIQGDPSGTVSEHYTKLANGLLELRDRDGVVITFRRVESGTFPASAVKKLEGRRGGADSWEKKD